MSWLLARVYDWAMRGAERKHIAAWRGEVLGSVQGEVLEIGAGTGANLDHYPSGLERLVMLEPDAGMRARLHRKLEGSSHRGCSEVGSAKAESLPYEDGSFDWVVSTLVLCSVRDPARALAELRRVLRPGGQLAFVEHVLDPEDARNRRRQIRYQPLWGKIAAHCQVTRDTASAIEESGFQLDALSLSRLGVGPRIVRPMIRGLAARV